MKNENSFTYVWKSFHPSIPKDNIKHKLIAIDNQETSMLGFYKATQGSSRYNFRYWNDNFMKNSSHLLFYHLNLKKLVFPRKHDIFVYTNRRRTFEVYSKWIYHLTTALTQMRFWTLVQMLSFFSNGKIWQKNYHISLAEEDVLFE